ncbi:hypothetical protein PWT90_07464 [Aphanocladium album]|nr:hypothetical protein PWT90_07464 [Aphanocladium album]
MSEQVFVEADNWLRQLRNLRESWPREDSTEDSATDTLPCDRLEAIGKNSDRDEILTSWAALLEMPDHKRLEKLDGLIEKAIAKLGGKDAVVTILRQDRIQYAHPTAAAKRDAYTRILSFGRCGEPMDEWVFQDCYKRLCIIDIKLGDITKASEWLTKFENLASTPYDKAIAFELRAIIYFHQKDFESSIRSALKCIEILIEAGETDMTWACTVANHIGAACCASNEIERAAAWHEETLLLLQRSRAEDDEEVLQQTQLYAVAVLRRDGRLKDGSITDQDLTKYIIAMENGNPMKKALQNYQLMLRLSVDLRSKYEVACVSFI